MRTTKSSRLSPYFSTKYCSFRRLGPKRRKAREIFTLVLLLVLVTRYGYTQTDANNKLIRWPECIKVLSFARDYQACGTNQNYPNCNILKFQNVCKEGVSVNITVITTAGESGLNKYDLRSGQTATKYHPDFVQYKIEVGPLGTTFVKTKSSSSGSSQYQKSTQQVIAEPTENELFQYQEYNRLIVEYNKAAQAGNYDKLHSALQELAVIAAKYFPEDVSELNLAMLKVQAAEEEKLKASSVKNTEVDRKLDELEKLISKQKILLSKVLKGDISAAEELNNVNLKINDLNSYFLQHSQEFSSDQSERLQKLASKMAEDITRITETELDNLQKRLKELDQAEKSATTQNNSTWPIPIYTFPSKSLDRTPIKGQSYSGGKLNTN